MPSVDDDLALSASLNDKSVEPVRYAMVLQIHSLLSPVLGAPLGQKDHVSASIVQNQHCVCNVDFVPLINYFALLVSLDAQTHTRTHIHTPRPSFYHHHHTYTGIGAPIKRMS